MRYFTDQQAAELPALADADDAARGRIIDAAETVYRYVRRNEWVDEDKLRTWGEKHDIDPDTMNGALEVLQASGRLFGADAAADTPAPAPVVEDPDAPVAPVAVPERLREALGALDKPALDKAASQLDVPGRSSLRKEELVDAIIQHGMGTVVTDDGS